MNKCEFCISSVNKNGHFVCVADSKDRIHDCDHAVIRMLQAMEYQANSRNTRTYNINKKTENRK